MTGEVTLRGRVLPIGGLKEKSVAAHRYGIRHVIIPAGNVRELDEFPAEIRNSITFHAVKTMDEVLALAIRHPAPPPSAVPSTPSPAPRQPSTRPRGPGGRPVATARHGPTAGPSAPAARRPSGLAECPQPAGARAAAPSPSPPPTAPRPLPRPRAALPPRTDGGARQASRTPFRPRAAPSRRAPPVPPSPRPDPGPGPTRCPFARSRSSAAWRSPGDGVRRCPCPRSRSSAGRMSGNRRCSTGWSIAARSPG